MVINRPLSYASVLYLVHLGSGLKALSQCVCGDSVAMDLDSLEVPWNPWLHMKDRSRRILFNR